VLLQASWIINTQEPDERDITAAFLVFRLSERLAAALHSMPQVTGLLLRCISMICVHRRSRFDEQDPHHINESRLMYCMSLSTQSSPGCATGV
jgi:hypothetical protein